MVAGARSPSAVSSSESAMAVKSASMGAGSIGERPNCRVPDRPTRFSTWNLYGFPTRIAAMEAIVSKSGHHPGPAPAHYGPSERLPTLMLGAIGVVYGDIGTSPL